MINDDADATIANANLNQFEGKKKEQNTDDTMHAYILTLSFTLSTA